MARRGGEYFLARRVADRGNDRSVFYSRAREDRFNHDRRFADRGNEIGNRDPRDILKIKRLQQRVLDLEINQEIKQLRQRVRDLELQHEMRIKETESSTIVWDEGDEEEEHPFYHPHPWFFEPIYQKSTTDDEPGQDTVVWDESDDDTGIIDRDESDNDQGEEVFAVIFDEFLSDAKADNDGVVTDIASDVVGASSTSVVNGDHEKMNGNIMIYAPVNLEINDDGGPMVVTRDQATDDVSRLVDVVPFFMPEKSQIQIGRDNQIIEKSSIMCDMPTNYGKEETGVQLEIKTHGSTRDFKPIRDVRGNIVGVCCAAQETAHQNGNNGNKEVVNDIHTSIRAMFGKYLCRPLNNPHVDLKNNGGTTRVHQGCILTILNCVDALIRGHGSYSHGGLISDYGVRSKSDASNCTGDYTKLNINIWLVGVNKKRPDFPFDPGKTRGRVFFEDEENDACDPPPDPTPDLEPDPLQP